MLNTVEKVEVLKNISLFEGLNNRQLLLIALITTQESVESGEILCEEGEKGDELYLHLEGDLGVFKGKGEKMEKVATVPPLGVVGETALFTEQDRKATLKACSDCEVLIISRELIQELVMEYPHISLSIIQTLLKRSS